MLYNGQEDRTSAPTGGGGERDLWEGARRASELPIAMNGEVALAARTVKYSTRICTGVSTESYRPAKQRSKAEHQSASEKCMNERFACSPYRLVRSGDESAPR